MSFPYCRYIVQVRAIVNGFFYVTGPRPDDGWFHVVFNLIGPNDGEGFTVYNDGVQVGASSRKIEFEYAVGDGRIVLGRATTNDDRTYSSVYVDELYFYNSCLAEEQITRLSQ